MSAPDLNAIRARAAAATKGPWEVERWEDFGGSPSYSIPGAERFREYRNSIECGEDEATAEFIAHARQDIPALCDEVERLRHYRSLPDGYVWQDYYSPEDVLKIREPLDAENERLRAVIAEVETALSNHPECDKYGPDDVISCGWKKAVADVQRAVEGVEL